MVMRIHHFACAVTLAACMLGLAAAAQRELGVPVLDPVLCGVKFAEMGAQLWRRFGVTHSKVGGYEPPPREELIRVWRSVYGSEFKSSR